MRTLTWREYLGSLDAEDESAYYTELYGDVDKARIIVNHNLKNKNILGLKGLFNTVDSIDKMPFGQFIMAESALSSGHSNSDALRMLANAVIRPIGDKEFDNTDDKKEEIHQSQLLVFDAIEILNEIDMYIVIRNEFIKEKYAGVFYKKDSEETDNNEYEESALEAAEANFSKQWYWYNIIRVLANENIMEYENILMMKMQDIAPELAFRRQRQIIEEIREKTKRIRNG